MASLKPREPYTDAELSALYPPNLELQLVQILLRHGERSPVSPRFQNTGLRKFWPYCSVVRNLKSAVLVKDGQGKPGEAGWTQSTLNWKRRLETFGEKDAPVLASGPKGELDDICDMGSLTDKGRRTTYELGERFRSLYVDRLGFLPKVIKSTDFLYLRATPIPRALESMQQTFEGLYPFSTREAGPDGQFPEPVIILRSNSMETLYPNDAACRRFAELSGAFAKRAADRWNNTPEMEYLNKKLGKWMPPDSPRVAVDGHPRLSGIMDTINATDAHGPATKLPKEFYDSKARQLIEKIVKDEWYDGYAESREYRTLGIGGLMADIVSRMVGSAEKSAGDGEYEVMKAGGQSDARIKFGLSGCHDTTLAGMLASLGALQDWPPFTSHIAVELFRSKESLATKALTDTSMTATAVPAKRSWWGQILTPSSSPGKPGTPPAGIGRKSTEHLTAAEKAKIDGYYVRVLYNNRPITVPGCRLAGNHLEEREEFCTLSAFKAIVDRFTPHDWQAQCIANLRRPASPTGEPEPAGF